MRHEATNPLSTWLLEHDPLLVRRWETPETMMPGVHHAASPYVEWCWLPVLGSSSILILRRLAHHLALAEAAGADVTRFSLRDLSMEVGFGGSVFASTGVLKTLGRLVAYGHAHVDLLSDVYEVRTLLPNLPSRYHAKLTPALREIEEAGRALDPTPVGQA